MGERSPHRAAFRRDVLWCLGLTVVFELISCVFRFGLRLRATRDTRFLRALTFGLRVHHGYPGLLFLMLALLVPPGFWRRWALRIGLALIFSDLMHHFVVLWPLTGYADFDLLYPP